MKKLRSAIILCGGKGTRLGAISKNSKTLIKIHQRVLWYIIVLSKISLIILFFR